MTDPSGMALIGSQSLRKILSDSAVNFEEKAIAGTSKFRYAIEGIGIDREKGGGIYNTAAANTRPYPDRGALVQDLVARVQDIEVPDGTLNQIIDAHENNITKYILDNYSLMDQLSNKQNITDISKITEVGETGVIRNAHRSKIFMNIEEKIFNNLFNSRTTGIRGAYAFSPLTGMQYQEYAIKALLKNPNLSWFLVEQLDFFKSIDTKIWIHELDMAERIVGEPVFIWDIKNMDTTMKFANPTTLTGAWFNPISKQIVGAPKTPWKRGIDINWLGWT